MTQILKFRHSYKQMVPDCQNQSKPTSQNPNHKQNFFFFFKLKPKNRNVSYLRVRHNVIIIMTETTGTTHELPKDEVPKSVTAPTIGVSTSDLLGLVPALLLHVVREAPRVVRIRRNSELFEESGSVFFGDNKLTVKKRGRGRSESIWARPSWSWVEPRWGKWGSSPVPDGWGRATLGLVSVSPWTSFFAVGWSHFAVVMRGERRGEWIEDLK